MMDMWYLVFGFLGGIIWWLAWRDAKAAVARESRKHPQRRRWEA